MAGELVAQRAFFGGAITSIFPLRFEAAYLFLIFVLLDPSRDEILIFEFLEMKHEVPDDQSSTWFVQELANEQDAEL
ncbi:hypothetical protein SAY87_001678 [Trapa incisa]|uniref:Uncharacterized protein n=1 Tax=Trapa incisa TaxID=236973 RepID=A0AAN7PTK4_9MYRT|nr:hypothetical protein SAY87_001678 [Trapa incisa]